MIGTLLTHSGAVRITREELRAIAPPSATRTWKPIGHGELIDVLGTELARRGLEVREEAYAVQHDGARLFGVIDLVWRKTDAIAAAVGLRTANDKTLSLQLAVGFRVLVCDNLVFSGDLIALRRKHTGGLDLPKEVAKALDRYQAGIVSLERGIERLNRTVVSDREAKEVMFDAFQQAILPIRFFRPVSEAYFGLLAETPGLRARTLWALHNAFTVHIQMMPPAPAFQATTRLGKIFGLSQN